MNDDALPCVAKQRRRFDDIPEKPLGSRLCTAPGHSCLRGAKIKQTVLKHSFSAAMMCLMLNIALGLSQ